jgi:hypothetical protein
VIATQKGRPARRTAAAFIHDMDKDRSKWGLTVVLLCIAFWMLVYQGLRAFL